MGERSGQRVDDVGRRVHILDTSPAWAQAVAGLVGDRLEVEASWSTTCDVACGDLDVDVLLVAVDIAALDPIVKATRGHRPDAKVVVLLGADDPLPPARSCNGALRRSASPDELLYLLRDCLRGSQLRAHRTASTAAVAPGRLTPAEARVLRLVAAGGSNDRIASDLGVSPNTVRTHVQRVTAKLGADNRLQAVAFAREAGVLTASWDGAGR